MFNSNPDLHDSEQIRNRTVICTIPPCKQPGQCKFWYSSKFVRYRIKGVSVEVQVLVLVRPKCDFKTKNNFTANIIPGF